MVQTLKNKSFSLVAKKNKTYVILAIVFVILLLIMVCLVFAFSIQTIGNVSSPILTTPTNITHFNINRAQINPRLSDEFWNSFNYNFLFNSQNPNDQITNEENPTSTPILTPITTVIPTAIPTIEMH